jgi:hypothetical protein
MVVASHDFLSLRVYAILPAYLFTGERARKLEPTDEGGRYMPVTNPLPTILILTFIILAAAGGFATYQAKTSHFDCPECRRPFKVGVFAYFFAQHWGGGRYVTCPHCFNSGMLPPIPD